MVRWLWPATAAQLALIWFWHAPPILMHAGHAPLVQVLMQGSLLAAALWFWAAVLSIAGARRWQPILALLVTSKLFCLLGVLLTFSPRTLFGGMGASHAATMADQQLAGLMMLVACPATYLVAGVWLSAKWLIGTERVAPGLPHA